MSSANTLLGSADNTPKDPLINNEQSETELTFDPFQFMLADTDTTNISVTVGASLEQSTRLSNMLAPKWPKLIHEYKSALSSSLTEECKSLVKKKVNEYISRHAIIQKKKADFESGFTDFTNNNNKMRIDALDLAKHTQWASHFSESFVTSDEHAIYIEELRQLTADTQQKLHSLAAKAAQANVTFERARLFDTCSPGSVLKSAYEIILDLWRRSSSCTNDSSPNDQTLSDFNDLANEVVLLYQKELYSRLLQQAKHQTLSSKTDIEADEPSAKRVKFDSATPTSTPTPGGISSTSTRNLSNHTTTPSRPHTSTPSHSKSSNPTRSTPSIPSRSAPLKRKPVYREQPSQGPGRDSHYRDDRRDQQLHTSHRTSDGRGTQEGHVRRGTSSGQSNANYNDYHYSKN
jgi:hypothetical protein